MNIFLKTCALILCVLSCNVHAYDFYFRNDYRYPATFTLDYTGGQALCFKDTRTVAANGGHADLDSLACCWNKVTIDCNGKRVHFSNDVYKWYQIGASCDSGTVFWIHADGSYGISNNKRKGMRNKTIGHLH